MITIGNTVISEDIVDKFFVCDLQKCKGACCVEGDAGAPLEKKEAMKLEKIYDQVKPYLSKAGIKTIEKEGFYVEDEDGDFSTPTIKGKECVYALYDKQGILKCGIEQAYLDGKVKFRKPISCYLYPIRITKYDHYEAVNYERWHICNPACRNGKDLGIPLYIFLKEPLISKYGKDWYSELEKQIRERESQK